MRGNWCPFFDMTLGTSYLASCDASIKTVIMMWRHTMCTRCIPHSRLGVGAKHSEHIWVVFVVEWMSRCPMTQMLRVEIMLYASVCNGAMGLAKEELKNIYNEFFLFANGAKYRLHYVTAISITNKRKNNIKQFILAHTAQPHAKFTPHFANFLSDQ